MDKQDKMKAIDLMIVLGGKGKGKMEGKPEMEDEGYEKEMCKCPSCGEEFECENCD